ncbi:predicted protein [Botrytis cinerea T4]|uniref:Uncharacterized protein n=1 Tax=Botryotinia fuckeliana (strain T4) TaxID=999810 RepID=G2YFY9_BOTF4|nr:predicted protein [Botrytis cinerea T4]
MPQKAQFYAPKCFSKRHHISVIEQFHNTKHQWGQLTLGIAYHVTLLNMDLSPPFAPARNANT